MAMGNVGNLGNLGNSGNLGNLVGTRFLKNICEKLHNSGSYFSSGLFWGSDLPKKIDVPSPKVPKLPKLPKETRVTRIPWVI